MFKYMCDLLKCKKNTILLYLKILSNGFFLDNELQNNDLKILISNSLVYCLVDREQKKIYYAVDPNISWNAFLLKKIWEHDTVLYSMDKKEMIPAELKRLNKRINKIIEYLSKIYIVSENDKDKIFAFNDKIEIVNSLVNFLSTATNKIYALVYHPYLLGEPIWSAVTECMKKNVKYVRISKKEELFTHGYKVVNNEIKIGVNLKYMNQVNDCIFYIKDDSEVYFILLKENTFTAQHIKNTAIVKLYRNNFAKMLEDSIDAKEHIGTMQNKIKEKMKNSSLTLTQKTIILEIFNYGIFTDGAFIKKYYSQIKYLVKSKILKEISNNHYCIDWGMD